MSSNPYSRPHLEGQDSVVVDVFFFIEKEILLEVKERVQKRISRLHKETKSNKLKPKWITSLEDFIKPDKTRVVICI